MEHANKYIKKMYIYIYIRMYVYMCVCVCVCQYVHMWHSAQNAVRHHTVFHYYYSRPPAQSQFPRTVC